ncbi:MAG: hypothetical protein H6729_00070 [Deltaproteobacteria bacterium]|nr:hypothetical protein [Deltaproteobacteria bacterium]
MTYYHASFRENLAELHHFAFLYCGDREDAVRYLERLADHCIGMESGWPGRDVLFASLAREIEESLGRKAATTFAILDNILRSDITRPINFDAPEIQGDETRIPVLLWELKRTCLTRVLGCLPPSVRVAMLLVDLHNYTPTRAAEILGIKESALRVRLTRARKRVEDFLAPRCQHYNVKNPCRCETRLGIAIDAKFVSMPPHDRDTPQEPHDADPGFHDAVALLRSLPQVKLSTADMWSLLERLDDTSADERAEASEAVEIP